MQIDTSAGNKISSYAKVKAAGVRRWTMRATMGAGGRDGRFAAVWAATREVGIEQRDVYHYVRTGASAQGQIDNILAVTGGDFGNGPLSIDCERTEAERKAMAAGWAFPRAAYTAMVHELIFGMLPRVPGGIAIYTSKAEWEAITTGPEWATDPSLRKWIAMWNSAAQRPDVPAGWTWDDWQYTNTGRVDGIVGNVDISRERVAMPIEVYPPQPRGALLGMHAEASSQTIPIMQKAKEAGAAFRVVLAMENPGLCVDAKRIYGAGVTTIARWTNPNPRWEGGQDVASWSQAERLDFARHCIQLIFDRTNDTEYQACDLFCPGLNEWDPPPPDGWREAAKVWMLLMEEAERRSPEMTAKGLHPIRLALPGCAQGTPEYGEMQDMKAVGLFEAMRAHGAWLLVHEGVFWDQEIDTGYGDLIPGAPYVPPLAGSACGRVNYWYALGLRVPWVSGEWYDGNRRETPNAKRLQALSWYERTMAGSPWFRGLCAFELTDSTGSAWYRADFTPVYDSAAMLAYLVGNKDRENGETEMDTAKIRAKAVEARDAAQEIITEVDAANATPLYNARVINVQALTVRDANGAPTGNTVLAGSTVAVYAEHMQAGTFQDRAKVNLNGNNVAMTSDGKPTLLRL